MGEAARGFRPVEAAQVRGPHRCQGYIQQATFAHWFRPEPYAQSHRLWGERRVAVRTQVALARLCRVRHRGAGCLPVLSRQSPLEEPAGAAEDRGAPVPGGYDAHCSLRGHGLYHPGVDLLDAMPACVRLCVRGGVVVVPIDCGLAFPPPCSLSASLPSWD